MYGSGENTFLLVLIVEFTVHETGDEMMKVVFTGFRALYVVKVESVRRRQYEGFLFKTCLLLSARPLVYKCWS